MPVSKAGINYQYTDSPAKPTVILSHPLGMNLHAWSYLVPELTSNFSVLRYDLPGHGMSAPYDESLETLPAEKLADDLLSLCAELNITQFHFVGTSIGGMLGQQLLVDHNERLLSATLTNTGMVIGSKAAWLDRQSQVLEHGLQEMAGDLVQRWFSKTSVTSYPNLLSQWQSFLADTDDRSYGLLCAWLGEQDMTNKLTAVSTPVMLIAGQDDIATPTSSLVQLAGKLNTSVVELKSIGHVPSVEASREFSDLVKSFLCEIKS